MKDGGEAPSPRTTPIGEGVYEVEGLGGGYYRSAFFVLSEFVVVFDAPLGLPAATRVLQEIRKVAGEKPVRYVVLSHFHNDHAAGVGAYVQAGASVVTVNREIVRRYAQARSALGGLEPPLLAPAPEPRIELVDRKLELRDAFGRNLLVFEVGPTTHVDSMLVLYDPKMRILVNGDLYSNLIPFNSTFASLVDWVQDRRLDVARVAGVHHPPVEFKELEELRAAWKTTTAIAKSRR